ncbi:MAG: cytochrome c family protein [Hyphomicrobiaceae bacterium]|nr:cytochrome c family protein [Hyphomicrobiaceae bacterium]
MAQLFRPGANTAFRLGIIVAVSAVGGLLAFSYFYVRSDWFWRVGVTAAQPIPFRHDIHVSGIGIACAFCHSTAERSAHAGMPTAHACLICHSQILQGATMLEPLRTSVALGQPIVWASVHRLPSFAYFHHGAHVSSGIACETCHGRVEEMPQTHKVNTLSMGWCLDCHRDPANHVRSAEAEIAAQPGMRRLSASKGQPIRGSPLRAASPLTNCSVCHR